MNEGKNEVDVVLKGCVRAEKLEDPSYYIPALLERARKEHLKRIYEVKEWEDDEDFLK